MITLQDIFDDLTYGELFTNSLTGDIDETKQIGVEDYPVIINHVNKGLTALHTRFNLKDREVVVQQYDDITLYELDSDFAQSNTDSLETTKYILDNTEFPFTDDIIRIEQIYDEIGELIPINDDNSLNSVYLTNYKTIQVPQPVADNTLAIIYRANHARLSQSITDPSSVEIDIPEYCREPLLAYVASRIHSRNLTQEGQAVGSNYMARYELLCQELERRNVFHNAPNDTNNRIEKNGWV